MTNPLSRPSLLSTAKSTTRSAFVGIAVLSAATNILMLAGPLYMMQIYDRVLASRSVPTLVVLSTLILGIYLFQGVIETIRARVLSRIGSRLDADLSDATFKAGLLIPLRTRSHEGTLQPMRDLDQVRQFMSGPGPIAIFDLPWLPVFLAVLFVFHPYLGWLATVGAGLLVALTLLSEWRLRSAVRQISSLSALRAEYLTAARTDAETIHAMGMVKAYAARWQTLNDEYQTAQAHAVDVGGGFGSATKILRLALQSAVLGFGAWLAIIQEISPGAMIAASILTARALAPIEQAIGQWKGFVSARQSRSRLKTLLEEQRDKREPLRLAAPKASLELAGLGVAAPGTSMALVHDVSFRLEAGQSLGIIGPSGSGKTSIGRALVGIWPAAQGSIRLDNAELDQWTPEALGPSIGYLPQEVGLFSGTVAENISRFQNDVDPQTIVEAATLAGVHDLILKLADGYNTQIGARGTLLSAGQRQRVGLARALFGRPFLIVLDEPNSNLDADGDRALLHAIKTSNERGAIVVMIAHRPNVMAAVSHALVLDAGRQVAFGPRDEVLRRTTIRPIGAVA